MATTIAQLTLTSTDLLSDSLAVSAVATLTAAGSSTGLTRTEGLGRKQTGNTSEYTLFTASEHTDDKAHKIYLKNTSTTAAQYFDIKLGDIQMGRLYAGDWAFFPWNADTGTTPDADVLVTPSHADMMIEYMLFTDE
tara:strand:+ start:347 stop:757 length:411 start_codon:yes stop_codon:yes gene_type:complete